ncbi:stage III sporulation protein AF [Paenibacillus sp. IB182496]|uniref:Stage III sporulation protein AF n=1 Tax=Paenibacillus sabuli TaxID=2772509 RepID=A0A927GSZ6_9BACL|nr:stage III sporulation protein AF [Paenibacillus sabuli]MBD2847289.1 stage III sporulation protein AF [Paenibacillus sabuli]
MEWLTDWLRQVIAILLLGGLVDLLLPSDTFQRYVRLVVGLLILLTLLTPILRLMQGDFTQQIVAGWDEWAGRAQQQAGMANLEDITDQAARLTERREAQAALLVQTQLAAAMQDALEQEGILAEEVRVSLTAEAQGAASLEVERVQILLAPEREEGAAKQRKEQAIDQVREVTVDVTVPLIALSSADQDGDSSVQGDSGERLAVSAHVQRVKQIVAAGWSIAPERVEVRLAAREGETGHKEGR